MLKTKRCCSNVTEGGAHAAWLESVIQAAECHKTKKVFRLLLFKGHRLTPRRYNTYHERLYVALHGIEGDPTALGKEMVRWVNRRWWRRCMVCLENLDYVKDHVFSTRVDVHLLSPPPFSTR